MRCVPTAHNAKAQGNALGNEGQKPRRGEIIVHPHHALRGHHPELTRRADAQPLAQLKKQRLLKNQQPLGDYASHRRSGTMAGTERIRCLETMGPLQLSGCSHRW